MRRVTYALARRVIARLGLLLWLLVVLAAASVILAACADDAPAQETAETAPTRTLVPPTAIPTPIPLTPSITPTDLPGPAALAAATQQAATHIAATEDALRAQGEAGSAPGPALPPEVEALIAQGVESLVESEGVAPVEVRLLSVEAFTWPDTRWGCTMPADTGAALAAPEPASLPGYRLIFRVGSRVVVFHTDDQDRLFVCEDRDWLSLEGEPLVLDPIAGDMLELVRADAAVRLELGAGDLRLVSLLTVNWPDSGVGCPRPGADYADRLTPGYRMVLRAPAPTVASDGDAEGDADGEALPAAALPRTLIYHTSVRDFVLCNLEEEILPGMLRYALPSPTPVPDEE